MSPALKEVLFAIFIGAVTFFVLASAGCPSRPPTIVVEPSSLDAAAGEWRYVEPCPAQPSPKTTDTCRGAFTTSGAPCARCVNAGCVDVPRGVYCVDHSCADPACGVVR